MLEPYAFEFFRHGLAAATLAGALCGLAAGLMADAGWRLFCHYSDPAHVFGAHTLAILITTATGSLLCGRWLARSPGR